VRIGLLLANFALFLCDTMCIKIGIKQRDQNKHYLIVTNEAVSKVQQRYEKGIIFKHTQLFYGLLSSIIVNFFNFKTQLADSQV